MVAVLAVLAAAVLLGRSGAKPAEPARIGVLRLSATYPLSITEPSDLTIDESGSRLWTVTNNPDRVYELDVKGKVVKTLNYVGGDLEGIAYDRSSKTLWIAEENRREIVHLDLNGDVLSRHPLKLVGEKNSGLEGLCLDDSGHMFALNEKRPGLFIELDDRRSIAQVQKLGFAKDYSGLSYDRKTRGYWIVSDQSQKLYLWGGAKGVRWEYDLGFPKAEGVACDEVARLIYVVSDATNNLYVYQVP